VSLSQLGEFAVIDRITARIRPDDRVLVGPGDDAAVVRLTGPDIVVSTDALIEGVHFRRDWSEAVEVGRKAVAVNVADIEAMGADPVAIVVALSVPSDLDVEWVDRLSEGIVAEAEAAGVSLVGGDLSRAPVVMIAVTVFGDLAGRSPVLRSGARAGQVLAMRGRLGWSAAGLTALSRGFRSPRDAVAAHRVPQVPYGAGAVAAAAGATAMIDISDGLMADLGHLARASGVVCDVRSDSLEVADPVRAVAAATGSDPLVLILTGGEDHALVAGFEPGAVPQDWQVIGELRAPGAGAAAGEVLVDGAAWEGDAGFDHFAEPRRAGGGAR